uniref:LRAT domain-containing protein n=1 Tax=Sparus aurata TaxID=8175 RepID=A0A671VHQ4_SPAAU
CYFVSLIVASLVSSFPRKYVLNKPLYSHFAIYVGTESGVNVGQGDNDIFHRTEVKMSSSLLYSFGKLAKVRKGSEDRKYNYLDDHMPDEFRSPDKIKERIKEMKGKCGKYRPIKNNCEHLATYVRYGIQRSLTTEQYFFWLRSVEETPKHTH